WVCRKRNTCLITISTSIFSSEIAWTVAYFIRFFLAFNPILGFKGVLGYLFLLNLFPTMPRHNFWKVAPLVKSIKYQIAKTIKSGEEFGDLGNLQYIKVSQTANQMKDLHGFALQDMEKENM
ncbi:hypothetical protein E2320_021039, partial [Naja naja]